MLHAAELAPHRHGRGDAEPGREPQGQVHKVVLSDEYYEEEVGGHGRGEVLDGQVSLGVDGIVEQNEEASVALVMNVRKAKWWWRLKKMAEPVTTIKAMLA